MKRKIRLIVSVASLALSMALAMAGVYAAATTRQAAITGTISFRTENVRAEVTVFEYIGAAPGALDETHRAGYKGFTPADQTGLDVTLGTKVGGTGGSIPMTDANNTYTIVVRIKNNNNPGAINVTVVPPSVSGAGLAMTPTNGTSPIAAGTTQEWKYVFTVTPGSVTGSTLTSAISASFTLANA